MYEVFEHTADLGLRMSAASLEELFVEAGRGLTSLIVTDLNTIQPCEERTLEIQGTQVDYLLFDWLTELLIAFETDHWLCRDCQITRNPAGITAVCTGERLDASRHQLEHEVKAITYHGLQVQNVNQSWTAEVIIDI